MNQLLATKPFEDLQAEHAASKLKRALGPWQLTFLGVGAIIGAGIFVLTGHEAAQHAGPAIVLSFVLAGVACVFAGLCYAEFASMVRSPARAYTYGYATLGEFVAWIIGWDLMLEYLFAASTVAVGWSGYFVKFLEQYHIGFPSGGADVGAVRHRTRMARRWCRPARSSTCRRCFISALHGAALSCRHPASRRASTTSSLR